MVQPTNRAALKLVTIIATSELEERLVEDLRVLGATGYTISRASGGGLHGPRTRGMWDQGNVRIETVVAGDVADRVLDRVVSNYERMSIIAFMHDVLAVPREHFVKTK